MSGLLDNLTFHNRAAMVDAVRSQLAEEFITLADRALNGLGDD